MKTLSWMAFSLVLASCGGGGGGEAVEPIQPVAFQALELFNPPAFAAGTYILRSQDELNSAWLNAPQTYPGDFFSTTPKPVPTVDFSNSSVLGVSLGVGTRCYIPQVVEVTEQGTSLLLKYRSGEPDGPTTLACLHPWPLAAFIVVPKLKGAVSFLRVPS